MSTASERSEGRRGITLIEMLVAFTVSSLVLASAGSLLMNSLDNYRNAQYLAEGMVGQSSADSILQRILIGASLSSTSRKCFNTTPSVRTTDGGILCPRAFAYDRCNLDNDPTGTLDGSLPSPPMCEGSNPLANTNTGIVYWYRAGPQGPPYDETTRYNESTLYLFEIARSQLTTYFPGKTSLCDLSDDDVLGSFLRADGNGPALRRRSRVLGIRVASLTFDDSRAPDIQYRLEFQLAGY